MSMEKCYICEHGVEEVMFLSERNFPTSGYYGIVIKGHHFTVCPECFANWNKVLEFLVTRFKEQKYIDETICKMILGGEDKNIGV